MTSLNRQSDPTVVWDLMAKFSGALAFDVGANGGVVANILARRFNRVVAFEPCAESYADLLDRKAPNVEAQLCALSDGPSSIDLGVAQVTSAFGELVTGDSLRDSWGDVIAMRTVPAMTLDEATDTFGVPDFVKIDTEGHEVKVIAGGLTTLHIDRPLLLVEVHAEANGPEIHDMLPDYMFDRIDHEGYPPESFGRANHFYEVGVPK